MLDSVFFVAYCFRIGRKVVSFLPFFRVFYKMPWSSSCFSPASAKLGPGGAWAYVILPLYVIWIKNVMVGLSDQARSDAFAGIRSVLSVRFGWECLCIQNRLHRDGIKWKAVRPSHWPRRLIHKHVIFDHEIILFKENRSLSTLLRSSCSEVPGSEY
jgi:hypothetical protein